MKRPKAKPATPDGAAEMLAVQRSSDPRSPTMRILDAERPVEHFESLAAPKAADYVVLADAALEVGVDPSATELPPGSVGVRGSCPRDLLFVETFTGGVDAHGYRVLERSFSARAPQ